MTQREEKSQNSSDSSRRSYPLAKAITAYSIVIGYVALGVLIGYFCERYFHSFLGYIFGTFLALIGIVFSLLRLLGS